ncbi:MAG: hypothetical protein EZS28_018338 [Streblomastix strix]|uniref:Protein kinase domain-containing protein n=1 Tax=Streblomastix strix TaxID=222440 RepID=A0A5J4VVC2_9EUKA|nr:MAG: hypothetical protein EZS28_018338 [Streblomastix strix]
MGFYQQSIKTLNIIAKQPQIPLSSNVLRALMKQILEGMRIFHESGNIHRDIKCDNILLNCPLYSERVYAKISDFGFAKKEDLTNKQTYVKGTLPFWAPELFDKTSPISQKVDIYALGITFYLLKTHKFPVNVENKDEQRKAMAKLKSIDRPTEIQDCNLWNLLSQMLEFDPSKRITAAEALQFPFFTSHEALADISQEQEEFAQVASFDEIFGVKNISEYDKNPTFIVTKSSLEQFINQDNIQQQKDSLQHPSSSQDQSKKSECHQNEGKEDQKEDNSPSFGLSSQTQDIIQKIASNQENEQKQEQSQINIPLQVFQITPIQASVSIPQAPLSQSQSSQSSSSSSSPHNSPHNSQTQQALNALSTYSTLSHYIINNSWEQLTYIPTKSELYAEQQLRDMNMKMRQINQKLDEIQKLQSLDIDILCANLIKRLQDNNKKCEKAFKLGIISKLQLYIDTLSVDKIFPLVYDPIITFEESSLNEQNQKSTQFFLLKLIRKLLQSECEFVLGNVTYYTRRFVSSVGSKQEVGKANPLLEEMITNGSIDLLLKIFHNDKMVLNPIKWHAMQIIGYLFKAYPIPVDSGCGRLDDCCAYYGLCVSARLYEIDQELVMTGFAWSDSELHLYSLE